jgi:hypothetical protein
MGTLSPVLRRQGRARNSPLARRRDRQFVAPGFSKNERVDNRPAFVTPGKYLSQNGVFGPDIVEYIQTNIIAAGVIIVMMKK